MIILNSEVYEFQKVFQKLSNYDFNHDIKLSFDIFKFLREINEKFDALEEFRFKLEKQYFIFESEKLQFDDNNQPILQEEKDIDEYVNKLNTLLSIEVELNDYNIKFTFDQLAGSGVVGNDFRVLERFLASQNENEPIN